ncbi:MAG: hypothetical protein RLY97_592 [Pseudomonadota bacterium]
MTKLGEREGPKLFACKRRPIETALVTFLPEALFCWRNTTPLRLERAALTLNQIARSSYLFSPSYKKNGVLSQKPVPTLRQAQDMLFGTML